MEHFRILLSEQKKALMLDVQEIIKQCEAKELELEALREKKNAANSALRSIEKKLEKL